MFNRVSIPTNRRLVFDDLQPWTPAKMSTVIWLDASDENTITLGSPTTVSQWDDKSGNDNHAVQTNMSYQPLTNINTINGLNALDFDGTDDIMTVSGFVHGNPVTDSTVFIVIKPKVVNQFGTSFSLTRSVTSRWQSHIPWSNKRIYFDAPNRTQYLTEWSANEPHLMCFIAQTGGNNVHEDGTFKSWTYNTSVIPVAGPAIGGSEEGAISDNHQNCAIGEFITFKGIMTSNLRQRVEGYLAWKWGLVSNLPVNHPFKGSRPL